MNSFFRMCALAFRLSCCLSLLSILIGCRITSTNPPDNGSTDGTSNRLRRGDPLIIIFTGVPDAPPKHDERIKDDGKITLPLIGSVDAADKTIGELQDAIRDRYVPNYYTRLNVIVNCEARFIHVLGEVKNPNRHQYLGEMTLLKAIAAAGDFTDFANRKNVQVIRSNGQKIKINCIKAQTDPKLDIPIYPDDRIFVPRRLF
jgi:protein involved in polysaccharide export with SLBB domain